LVPVKFTSNVQCHPNQYYIFGEEFIQCVRPCLNNMLILSSLVGLDIPVIVLLANRRRKKKNSDIHIEIWTPVSRRPKSSGDEKNT